MNERLLLEAVTTLGYRLAMAGAETFRVEESIIRVLKTYGYQAEAFAIPNCLTVSIITRSVSVNEIVVFSSEFSSAYINDNKLLRLNKVSQEASKQCKRAIAPKVLYKDTFISALEYAKGYKNKLFACEFASENKADFSSLSGDTAIVVGSEGGFSKEESELAISNGFTTVYLGKRILRAETAGIALTAIVMHAVKELE